MKLLVEKEEKMDSEVQVDKQSDQWLNATCPICGKKFHLKPYKLRIDKNHYCSRECHYEAKRQYMKGYKNHQYGLRKEKNASWKGGKKLSRYGYMRVLMPEHPFAEKDGTILEHRLVAEQHLLTDENSIEINGKKYLSPDYIVHHKNHNRLDNRPENLEIMKKGKHSSMHCLESPMPRDEKTGRFVSKAS